MQGYIAMLAVDNKYRGQGLASLLVKQFEADARANSEIMALVLDTECVNTAALGLYNCEITSIGVLSCKEI